MWIKISDDTAINTNELCRMFVAPSLESFIEYSICGEVSKTKKYEIAHYNTYREALCVLDKIFECINLGKNFIEIGKLEGNLD